MWEQINNQRVECNGITSVNVFDQGLFYLGWRHVDRLVVAIFFVEPIILLCLFAIALSWGSLQIYSLQVLVQGCVEYGLYKFKYGC